MNQIDSTLGEKKLCGVLVALVFIHYAQRNSYRIDWPISIDVEVCRETF